VVRQLWFAVLARPSLALGQHGHVDVQQLEDGRWRARCRIRDDDGVTRQVVRYRPTRAKAVLSMQAELQSRQRPTSGRLKPSTSVAEVARLWLDGITLSDLAPDTKRVYRNVAELHVIGSKANPSPLAGVPVKQLTVAALDATLRRTAKQSGRGAAKTLRTVYRGLLDLAVSADAIQVNPVRALPAVRHTRRPDPEPGQRDTRRSLTRAERDELLDSLGADPRALTHDLPDVCAFMLATGCRIGEAIALRWTRIDADARTVLIDAKLGRVAGEGVRLYEYTKGNRDSGVRTVALPDWMLQRLTARRQTAVFNEWGLVFPSPLGHKRDPSNTAHDLRLAFDAAGFPWLTSHTLRRTVATMLDDAGVSRSRNANQLGHSSTRMLDVYLDRRVADPRAADIL
jgi:integrase